MPHTLRSGLLALLLAALLPACDDGGTDPAPDSAGNVHGSVASVKTGAGVPNLVVALSSGETLVGVAATDEAGEFALDDIPAGDYIARLTGIELSGLSPRHTAFEPVEQNVRVDGSGAVFGFGVVGLIPPRVTGEITCGGVPAVGAQVRVIGGETDVVVTSNEQGKYGATDLGPGHHAVLLIASPCTISPGWAAVELLPGQAVAVDFGG
jgi:hypothetical protein